MSCIDHQAQRFCLFDEPVICERDARKLAIVGGRLLYQIVDVLKLPFLSEQAARCSIEPRALKLNLK